MLKTHFPLLATIAIAITISSPTAIMAQEPITVPKPAPTPTPVPAPKPKPKPVQKKETLPEAVISEPTGMENGYGYVDLGLPSGTMWATMNVGATRPSDYGGYYRWAEVSPARHFNVETDLSRDYKIKHIEGNPDYDAATASWKGGWKMPTSKQCNELIKECSYELTAKGGHWGYKFTGKNGNSIFIPAGHGTEFSTTPHPGKTLECWSSTYVDYPYGTYKSYYLDIYFNFTKKVETPRLGKDVRYSGKNIRPVLNITEREK